MPPSTLEPFSIFDFSGGIRRDVTPSELNKNELLDAQNVELNEKGRVKIRRGSYQYGNTLSDTIDSSFVYIRNYTGGLPVVSQFVVTRTSPIVLSRIGTARLTTAITTASTSIVVSSVNTSDFAFAANGTIEIEGDIITYTGNNAVDTFTGCTGITSSHAAGASVHQYETISQASSVDGRAGVYYAVLNNILVINGRGGVSLLVSNDDGKTTSNISGEPSGLFVTNYRDTLFMAGDGTAGTNGSARRVSFSNRGDPTTWTTGSDYFDVEDQRGEFITGFRVLNDVLYIFKTNSIFSYDEIELKQRVIGTGAYNHRVHQEINGLIYTFSPEGIFETNGVESRQIGEPVKEFWKNFVPVYDTTSERVALNTFSGKFLDDYILYIGDITKPSSIQDVMLVFNTKNRSWRVYTGMTNFTHLGSFNRWRDGVASVRTQDRPVLFGGSTANKYWRLFESVYVDSTPTVQGDDIYKDLISDTGTPISGYIETGLYDLGSKGIYKIFTQMRCFAERGDWFVSYRIEDERGIGEYKPLGSINSRETVLPFPQDARGWKIGFKIASSGSVNTPIFNGFVLEDTKVMRRK